VPLCGKHKQARSLIAGAAPCCRGRYDRIGYFAVNPPSTRTAAPTMKDAPSEARNNAGWAISIVEEAW
jgi:hypothetical protein